MKLSWPGSVLPSVTANTPFPKPNYEIVYPFIHDTREMIPYGDLNFSFVTMTKENFKSEGISMDCENFRIGT